MRFLPKNHKFVIASLFITLIVGFSFFTGTIFAADAIPPPGRIPCKDEVKNPEFSSDRPYQGSPCGDRPVTLWCGNDLVMDLGNVKIPYCDPGSGQATSCPANITKDQTIDVDLTNVQLPILGNTQLTKNSANPTDQIDDGTKVSQYVAWYLGGTNDKAEYTIDPTTVEGQSQLINTSGPLKKLLPTIIQDQLRLLSLESATKTVTYTPDDSENNATPAPVTEPENHNQIVVCYNKEIQLLPSWLTNFFGFKAFGLGRAVPKECYNSAGGQTQASFFRLKDWDETPFSVAYHEIAAWILSHNFLPEPLVTQIIAGAAFDRWPKKIPPLPWSDKDGKPFASTQAYEKAYNEWRGSICAWIPNIIGGGKTLICISIPFVTNSDYAELYRYIPLANTTDKKGAHVVTNTHMTAPRATIDNQSYVILHSPQLYEAHSLEDYQLSVELMSTYLAKGATPSANTPTNLPNDVEINKRPDCRIIPSSTNPGDDATFGAPKSHVEVTVHYHISEIQCVNIHYECHLSNKGFMVCRWVADCSSEVYATIDTVMKTAYNNEIWANTVAGNDSIFRRIYPQTGASAPVSCIADNPAASDATYTLGSANDPDVKIVRIIEPDKSSVKSDNGITVDAQLYFPHYGSVLDYFLNGIQTALRPKGYGAPTPANGQYCTNIQCGELPKLPNASGSCNLGGVSSRVGNIPQSLKDIISAAAETYKTPPNLILGIMYGEGLFNPGRLNWTDQNVKNWATCEKVPGCNESGDDNFMGFNGSDFANITPHILPDILKLDPTRTQLSQCNLLDAIYAEAYNLHASAAGGGGLPATCFGIPLSSSIPGSCSWNNSQYEDAIKVSESGYTSACFTLEGSCATGGGLAATCPGGDNCETLSNRYSNPSHNGCVWDVGHGN